MTDQQIFVAHKEQIQKKILTENNRRTKLLRVPELTPEETQAAVNEIIEIIRGGGRASEYKFQEPELPDAVSKQQEKLPVQQKPIQQRMLNGELIKFDIVLCSNGFVLNMEKNGEIQPFIFKNEKELMLIFKETLFSKLKKMKERGVQNGVEENCKHENKSHRKECEEPKSSQTILHGFIEPDSKSRGEIENGGIPTTESNEPGYGHQLEPITKVDEKLDAGQNKHSTVQTADQTKNKSEATSHSRENEQAGGRILLLPSESV